MKKVSILMICLLVVITSLGCQGSSGVSSEPSNSAQNIKAENFNLAYRNLYDYQVTDMINNDSNFMNEPPASTGDAVSTCIAGRLNTKFTKNSDGTYRLSIPDIDLTDCYTSNGISQVSSYKQAIFYDKILIKDAAGHITNLDNKTLSDVFDVSSSNVSGISRSYGYMQGTFDGAPYTSTFYTALHSTTGFDEPCASFNSNCRFDIASIAVSDSTFFNYTDVKSFTMNSLVYVPGAPYYGGGTITFTIDNWSGTMTYGTDANTAPTYTASNGSATVNGTFSYVAKPLMSLVSKGHSGVRL